MKKNHFHTTSINEVKVLQPDEIEILIRYLETRSTRFKKDRLNHACWISLALFSGLRENEIAKLRWGDVLQGFSFKRWFIPSEAKMGSRMPALMNGFSESMLSKLKSNKSQLIFPGKNGKGIRRETCYIIWQRIQIELFNHRIYSFHDLRHTAITNFYRECRDIELTRQFARHQSYLTTQRYVHIVERDKCELVLNNIEAQFRKVVGFIPKTIEQAK